MPDTPENQADFPQLDSQKPGLGFPIARRVVLISLAVGTVIDYSLGAYQGKGSGETSLLSQLFCRLDREPTHKRLTGIIKGDGINAHWKTKTQEPTKGCQATTKAPSFT